ncbi:MAG: hypothetical protein MJ201_01050 [Mycoplasmoidaceae bacterium]|nr:hypothetical protein [Mycoplasmoidaceae bacterium]
MKRKFILLPITLTALTLAIGLIGCNNPDTPTPEVTKYHFGFTGNYCKINGHGHIDIDIEQDSKVEYTVLPDDGFKLSETQDLPEGISLTGNLLTIEKMDKAYEVTINAELDKHVEFVISKSETSVETQSVL